MLACTRTHVHTLPCADPHGQTHVRARQLWRAMNYNTLCLKLSSCLHGSTLTSLSSALFTSLSASLLYASPQPCLCFPPFPPSPPLAFFCRPFFPSPPGRALFIPPQLLLFSTPSISIYISLSFLLCSFFAATLPLIYSGCVLALPPPLPLPLPPSHLRHTHLALPFIASGGWRATVSFNPSQRHLQTLTVARRLHRCLAIKAAALSKAGRG